MLKQGFEQFRQEPDVKPERCHLLTELTMDSLCGKGDLDEKDFLDRSELLCAMGQTVIVSSCEQYHQLNAYLSDFKIQHLGIVIEANRMLKFLSEKYEQNYESRLLAAFGEVFTNKVRFYIYPSYQEGSEETMTTHSLPVPEGLKFLYQHLLDNRQIVDIEKYDPDVLHIFTREVLELMKTAQPGWEDKVPKRVAKLVKEQFLFGYPVEVREFEY